MKMPNNNYSLKFPYTSTHSLHETDSQDISSDSEEVLNEIVITPSCFDLMQYDSQNSPIHICDNNQQQQPDEQINIIQHHRNQHIQQNPRQNHHAYYQNSTLTHQKNLCQTSEESVDFLQANSNQLTTNSCCSSKNSTSRRIEYSMRSMKLTGEGQNPSQDSAFGSMTDGEHSIASSSFRLSSFQSISSPIDERVENISSSVMGLTSEDNQINMSSTISSPCRDFCGAFDLSISSIARSTSESVSLGKSSKMGILASDCVSLTLEPPKILVNDQSSFNATSPSKACGVFSQKYRVSSFEDMSLRKTSLKNVNKLAFRSLEEEKRIDSAFQPISMQNSHMSDRVFTGSNDKFKKLTHVAFSKKITSTKERHTKWKNSILARKKILVKSNESLLDNCINYKDSRHTGNIYSGKISTSVGSNFNSIRINQRVQSTNELLTRNHHDSIENISNSTLPNTFHESRSNPNKSHSERYLFSLCKIKQRAINDYDEPEDHDRIFNSFALSRPDIVSFIDETSSSDDSSVDTSSSPIHRDVCQYIGGLVDSGGVEESTPLLNEMEMSPISPNDRVPLL